MIWGYYISPMSYGQNAIVINEFLDKRWSAVRFFHLICQVHQHFPISVLICALCSFLQPNHARSLIDEPTVGKALLKSRGMYTEDRWYWICIAVLLGFSLLFNLFFIAALTYLNRKYCFSY